MTYGYWQERFGLCLYPIKHIKSILTLIICLEKELEENKC